MLKKKVLVNGISNLSDARYCAGMMVDYLSFELETDHPDYISPHQILEIRNWLSGPKIGGRVGQWPAEYDWDLLNPDFLILQDSALITQAAELVDEIFLEMNNGYFSAVSGASLHIITSKPEGELDFQGDQFLSLNEMPGNLFEVIDNEFITGISLRGSRESRPGFTDYGDLMDILEALEEN